MTICFCCSASLSCAAFAAGRCCVIAAEEEIGGQIAATGAVELCGELARLGAGVVRLLLARRCLGLQIEELDGRLIERGLRRLELFATLHGRCLRVRDLLLELRDEAVDAVHLRGRGSLIRLGVLHVLP